MSYLKTNWRVSGTAASLEMETLEEACPCYSLTLLFTTHIIVHNSHFVFELYLLFFFFLSFLGPHPRHMEVLSLSVKSELRLLAYTTATATRDPSHVCDLHPSSWQCWVRPGMDPACAWILVGSIAAQPQWELLCRASFSSPVILIMLWVKMKTWISII